MKIDLNSIYSGDTLELLRSMEDQSVDLIVSSPPYNLGKEYETRVELNLYLERQKDVLVECYRVLRDTGSIFWQVGAYSDKGELIPLDIRFFPMLEDIGFTPRNRIVWVRQHGLHARRKFSCRHETVLWFTKTDDYKFYLDPVRVPQKWQNKKSYRGDNKGQLTCNPDGKNPGDIWLFRNVKHNHEEQTIHPCQFPEDMIARIVLSTTDVGDVVFVPYMGTGTVAVVAKEHERRFLGAEIDSKYIDVAKRRLSGEPDENGSFANLKCLRDYIERTGEPTNKYRFDVQVGKNASPRSNAKIFPEGYHLDEFEKRMGFEEAAFGARIRDEAPPADPNLNGQTDRLAGAKMVRTPKSNNRRFEPSLFDET